jgi:hypothetical protein
VTHFLLVPNNDRKLKRLSACRAQYLATVLKIPMRGLRCINVPGHKPRDFE